MDGNNSNGEAMTTALAERAFSVEQIALIKRTICKDATDDELTLFTHQCKRSGLDPFSRQIHAVKRWDSAAGRQVMTIQTGIDGYRLIADRTGLYAGNDEPVYDTETAKNPGKASVTVWKIVSGQRVPFTRSARWDEFKQTKKDGSLTKFWATMPYLMLGKVAEALALRAAFPQELSGIYTNEEMSQADVEHQQNHSQPSNGTVPATIAARMEPPPSRGDAYEPEPISSEQISKVQNCFKALGLEWDMTTMERASKAIGRQIFPGEKLEHLSADEGSRLIKKLLLLIEKNAKAEAAAHVQDEIAV